MKTKLTPELQKELISHIADGNYIVVACSAVGIDRTTLWQWTEKGKRAIKLEKEGKKLSEKQENYRNFHNAVKQASAIGELEIFSEIRSQVSEDWRAGMEILSRKYPQRWARKDRLEVKTKKTVVSKQIIEFRKEEKKLTVEERKQLVEFTMKAIEEHAGSNGN